MYAITGATGQLGRLVLTGLLKTVPASEIVALVRDPSKATDLAALGVHVRAADYERPETLGAALAGVTKLLLISSNELGRRALQHGNVIDAAKAQGVELIAYTGILHADSSPLGIAEEHRQTEAAVHASGLPFVLLRNGWYTENFLGGVDASIAHGAILGCSGAGRFATAARADYADAAVAVLTHDGQAGKTYELAGDSSFTKAEFAAELSRHSGKPVVYNDMTQGDYEAALLGFGLPPGIVQLVVEADVFAPGGALDDAGHDLSRLIGRPTTPLSHSVAAVLKG